MTTYTVDAGRVILRDGVPFVCIGKESNTKPVEADEFVRLAAAAPGLLDALILALPHVEEAAEDPVNNRAAVEALVAKIRAVINKVENS